MMFRLLLVADRGCERYEIVDDGDGGVTIFRYLGGQHTHDYWQHDVAMAKRCAEANWCVTGEMWRPPRPNEVPTETL